MDIKVRDFVLPGNFEPGFAATLQIKDMDLALQMGKDLNTPLMMANLARQFYQAVLTGDKGHKDTSIIYEIFEKFKLTITTQWPQVRILGRKAGGP
jgi:3-hydroxyisobutyrate dehydrogenase-like beta-hydroxyacid dehydrogenase